MTRATVSEQRKTEESAGHAAAMHPVVLGPGAQVAAAWALAHRELVRFFRQRTRVIGALGQPLIFWVLFGAGLHGSFRAPEWAEGMSREMSYQEYFFPGVAVMIILFTAIFSTISIIEDRREGFLQGVLVAPIPRRVLVCGKLVGGALLAVLQASLFLVIGPVLALIGLSPTISLHLGILDVSLLLAFLLLLSLALTGLGYTIAWPMQSTQGFHAIMSVFLMPMWLLSGAFFPGSGAGWLAWIIRLNPLTYGVAGLRRLLYPQTSQAAFAGLPSLATCVTVTAVFALTCVVIATAMTRQRSSTDTR